MPSVEPSPCARDGIRHVDGGLGQEVLVGVRRCREPVNGGKRNPDGVLDRASQGAPPSRSPVLSSRDPAGPSAACCPVRTTAGPRGEQVRGGEVRSRRTPNRSSEPARSNGPRSEPPQLIPRCRSHDRRSPPTPRRRANRESPRRPTAPRLLRGRRNPVSHRQRDGHRGDCRPTIPTPGEQVLDVRCQPGPHGRSGDRDRIHGENRGDVGRRLPEQILRVAPRQTPAAACDGMHRYQRHAQRRQRLTQM